MWIVIAAPPRVPVCLWLFASFWGGFFHPPFFEKAHGDVRLGMPLDFTIAIRALEPPLTWMRQHKEDMNDKYDSGLQTSASITALELIGMCVLTAAGG